MPEHLQENFEPERYELREGPAYQFQLDRREFLGVAGILLCVFTKPALGQQAAPLSGRLHLGENGAVTVLSGKVEVGQGSRTELAMAAAEELDLRVDRIRVVLADTDAVPNDGITAGSRTTPATVPAVRRAAAAVRELLFTSAARDWQVDRSVLQFSAGAVAETGGKRRLTLGDLASSYKAASDAALTLDPVDAWKVLGRSHPRSDAKDIVTGRHHYPSDIQRPQMLYGSVLRAPAYGATLADADVSEAEKLPEVVVVRDGNFVGCAAPTSYAARKAKESLSAAARWDTKDHPSSKHLFSYLKEHLVKEGQGGGRRPRETSKGSVQEGLAQARHKLRATYQVAFIQHAPMEPRAAVAEWEGERVTVWTGTQNPFGVRDQVAQAFRIAPSNVRVIVPDTGGAFGGKHTGEVAIEAARLARAAKRPVSLKWTRAEEFTWAYFRPAGLFELEAGLDGSGLLTAWDFTNYNAGTAGLESPYKVANARSRFLQCESPLREGSYRGIAATANNFARECFIDELAEAAQLDALEFRLANLDNARLRDVLLAAAKKFGWDERRKTSKSGTAVGLACGTEKGSYVAACVEVSAEPKSGTFRVLDLCMAFECGAILNPANLRAQVEGAIIQGLGGALTEEIRFENGRLENGRFASYRVPRFKDVPPITIELVDRTDLPSAGAGETPIIAVAPAIANAASRSVRTRLRSMPVRMNASA